MFQPVEHNEGKFIALKTHIIKSEKYHNRNLKAHLTALEQREAHA